MFVLDCRSFCYSRSIGVGVDGSVGFEQVLCGNGLRSVGVRCSSSVFAAIVVWDSSSIWCVV